MQCKYCKDTDTFWYKYFRPDQSTFWMACEYDWYSCNLTESHIQFETACVYILQLRISLTASTHMPKK